MFEEDDSMKLSDKEFKKYKHSYGVIYCVIDNTNNHIYIGQSRDIKQRIRQYRYEATHDIARHSKRVIYNVMRKKGIENFSIRIIQSCDSIDDLNKYETHWIKKLNSTDPKIGYNMEYGGGSYTDKEGKKLSKDEKRKISIPILSYKDGVFEYHSGAKEFADKVKLARTNVTHALKFGIRVRGYFVFYLDTELCKKSLEEVQRQYSISSRCDAYLRLEYIRLGEKIIDRSVEINGKIYVIVK